ncbi:hypothetical protein E2C01_088396 [Portunus trituberculatus]|uniref:Uncharacterized protein n=1 Tax=Portunus trituberculatus TaxID=210409 RepID=A0A5B7JAM5_PORTR|nr:hypothetical protein [Portunus trituberculatus]
MVHPLRRHIGGSHRLGFGNGKGCGRTEGSAGDGKVIKPLIQVETKMAAHTIPTRQMVRTQRRLSLQDQWRMGGPLTEQQDQDETREESIGGALLGRN